MEPTKNLKEEEKSKKILCKDWLSSISCHCYSRILIHESKLFSLLWVIFPSLMAALAFYFISETILNYLNYDVVTNIITYDQRKPLFPTISICNQNPFVTDFAVNYVQQLLIERGLTGLNTLNGALFSRFVIQSVIASENDKFKKKLAFNRNETIFSCFYNGQKCTDDDLDWYYDFNYGNCYKFNAGIVKGLKISNQPGEFNGLTFLYFLGKT